MGWIIFFGIWLVGGYIWARYFINHILDNGCWSDTKRPANPLMVHAAFPLMAPVVLFATIMLWWSRRPERDGSFVRKFYGVKNG